MTTPQKQEYHAAYYQAHKEAKAIKFEATKNQIKICINCKAEYLGKRCKPCRNIVEKALRAKNPGRNALSNKRYREANAEKVKAYSAKKYAKNPAKARLYKSIWKLAHPGYQAEYRLKNKERRRIAAKLWSENNPGVVKIAAQNRRARLLNCGGVLSRNLRVKLFKLQKGKCPCCRKPLGPDCHLDHIVPLFLGGSNTDDNIQLLRASCNFQKNKRHPVEFMQSRGFLL